MLGPALTSGKVDLVIAGMSATPERRQSLKFSKPYYESDLVVVVKKMENMLVLKQLMILWEQRLQGS